MPLWFVDRSSSLGTVAAHARSTLEGGRQIIITDCTVVCDPVDKEEKHVLQPVPTLDMLVLNEDGNPVSEGEAGQLFLAGSTVSPGYLGSDGRIGCGPESHTAFVEIQNKRYYR